MNKEAVSLFCEKINKQIEALVLSHVVDNACIDKHAADQNPDRAWCDAAEILAMFDLQHNFVHKSLFLKNLKQMRQEDIDYNILCVGYALEVLGTHICCPVAKADVLKGEALRAWLAKQYNRPRAWSAWGAGSDVDALGTAFYHNRKHFGLEPDLETLFDWLNCNVNPKYGMWGSGDNLLDMVNGFYRLTRGTYAQFNVDLPMPEKAIDTILKHAKQALDEEQHITACNTLDIIHPLWLCKKQSDYRTEEALSFAEKWVGIIIQHWTDGQGFAFNLFDHDHASLMGTEMWLSILYLLCDYLGISNAINYAPKGVHRLYTTI